jgi:Flp pilus assembly pilin Flp
MHSLRTLAFDDSAQGMTEYAILLGTLALGAILTLVTIGNRLKSIFNNVSTQVNNVPTT